MSKWSAVVVGLLAVHLCLLRIGLCSDWPTYLHDNARTGWTPDQLKPPLNERWMYSSPSSLRRAWSGPAGRTIEEKELRDRVKFDDALQIAIVGNRVYFGSSVDHQVHCLDAQSGKQLWRFFTGGPIRLAPCVHDGRLYVGSDDGYTYCLNADDGQFVWKLRLGPAEEWIIGRGEMISRWPVRTGVLVENDIAYFGAGIFPHENVYLCSVTANDGKIIWRNDKISHLDAGRNSLSPQGYLLGTPSRIFVPSARAGPSAMDPETGEVTSTDTTPIEFKQTRTAGTDALITDGRLHTYSLGTRLAATGKSYFVATGKEIIRLDRKTYTTVKRIESELADLSLQLKDPGDKADQYKAQIEQLKQQQKQIQNGGVLWRTPCTAEAALIVAGDLIFAGDEGHVTAFDFSTGQEMWKATVDGAARGLAVAGNNLLVSTTAGKIYCFADADVAQEVTAETPNVAETSPYPKDQWAPIYERTAEEILKHTNVRRGFCLVVGSERGRLAYELAKRSDLKIYGIEPDQAKVEASRRALSRAGLYGDRVTIHHSDLSDIPYANYFANLIVSDHLLLTGRIPGSPEKVIRHLKPAGGVICLGQLADTLGNSVSRTVVNQWLTNTFLLQSGTITTQGPWTLLTRGTLPGAGNWTHQYGEPGNTANSGDKLVKGGLGVLWYGDPGPGQMVNRHQGAVGPLAVNGRLFVQGETSLMAYDAYNGLFLWEQENPEATRTGVFQNNAPGNLAASEDRLFHMVRDKVLEHDAATGQIKATHNLPPSVDSTTHQWGYVASRDGLLFGTATIREAIKRQRRRRGYPGRDTTDTIFAIDLETGEHLWAYQGKSIAHHTIALAPDHVFFIDSTISSDQRAAIVRQNKEELKKLTGEAAKQAEERLKNLDVRLAVSLRAKTGEKLWSEPVDVTDCSDIGTGGGKLTLMYHDRVLLLCGANANGHYWNQFLAGEFSRRRLVALDWNYGRKLWAKDANYRHRPIIIGNQVFAEPWAFDLHTGEQQTRIHPLTGAEIPWSIMRPGHHCGMLTGCDNMLLFRSGYTGFYDLATDSGTRHFAGHRLGCWINAIPTNGLVVIPEASAGCVCMFSISSTIVMEPREVRRPWSLYSAVGPTTPVKHLALNLGAPGDRRDSDGKLWLAYPRPTPNPRLETGLYISLELTTQFLPEGLFFSQDGDKSESGNTWITSSGGNGLIRCSIPLLGKDDQPAVYKLRLHFAAAEDDKPGQRVFDVQIQGEQALDDVDVAAQGDGLLLTGDIENVEVTGDLVIGLIPKRDKPTPFQTPILSAIEVVCTSPL